MDTLTIAQRSERMRKIKNKDTQPEIKLRRALHRLGFRYKLHDKNLPGRPDLVFPRYKAIVLVHGCFWHNHGCSISNSPKTNSDFWKMKFDKNKVRDARVQKELADRGWKVIVVHECELSTVVKLENTVQSVAKNIIGS